MQRTLEMHLAEIDLQALSLDQLKKLERQLSVAISEFDGRRKAEAAAQVEELAKSLGFTLRELADLAPIRKRSEAVPKYCHPENPAITWSGRGRKPAWIIEALHAGKSLNDLAI